MDYTLTEDDIMHCRKAIEDLDDDGNGRVGINDLGTVLERMGMHYEQFQLCKLISELDADNKNYIQFQSILQVYQERKQQLLKSDDDQDTLDAYTAIGGPSDKSGHIDDQEFQLPINMEQLIKSVDDSNNGQIQYEEFSRMLQNKTNQKIWP